MAYVLVTSAVQHAEDVVLIRQKARYISMLIGFDISEQTRFATAVSEIARNTSLYATGGKAQFSLDLSAHPQTLSVEISDEGPGIAELDTVLGGRYKSRTGMGLGIIGAQRLVDHFSISSSPTGTKVVLQKEIKHTILTLNHCQSLINELARERTQNPYEEVHRQNQELLKTLGELNKKQDELTRLNHELEDTNKGVVALYAELDEKAIHLQRANEIKTRFLSNMTHEFRTPVNSILSLTHLLLQKSDGDLTAEQEKQVTFIRKAAENLSELVNDLLDIAKVEAGKIQVRPTRFELNEMLCVLRGILKPLVTQNSQVDLIVEEPTHVPALFTDEGKLSQILRNLISNAIKFTERGLVTVKSRMLPENLLEISVIDTGIGIAPTDQDFIFEEFTQLNSALHKKHKGTGLGLPLSKKLAELLGGTIELESALGEGSTFKVIVPAFLPEQKPFEEPLISEVITRQSLQRPNPEREKILIIDDDDISRYLVKDLLRVFPFDIIEAADGMHGVELAQSEKPAAVIVDLVMPRMTGFEVVETLKRSPETKAIPIIVHSSKRLEPSEVAKLENHVVGTITKETCSRDAAFEDFKSALALAGFPLNKQEGVRRV